MNPVTLTVYQGLAGDHNARAIAGARVVGATLASRLGVEACVVGRPVPVLATGWDVELEAARASLQGMAAALAVSLAQHAHPIAAVTRCAVALATLPVVVRHQPDACVVWFDAHADLNTPGTSPSGYLGGMALAGAAGLWDSGLGGGLALSDVVLVGTRDVDPPEQELIDRSGLRHVPVGAHLESALRDAVAGRPVYVHLDCDVLEAGLVPTDYAVAGGLTMAQLHAACAVLAEADLIGLEIAEYEDAGQDAGPSATAEPLIAALEPLLARLAGA